jgi:hypothetical protein
MSGPLSKISFLFNSENFRAYVAAKGWKPWDVNLAVHYYDLIKEQLMAIVPISVLLIGAMLLFFGRGVSNPPEMLFGLTAAILGLTLFVDSLRVCIMPMSDQLGVELPKVLTLPWILAVAFVLGVLVTYAEPAIASLTPLAKLVDPEKAPYLYSALLVCVCVEVNQMLVCASRSCEVTDSAAQLFTIYHSR